MPGIAFSPQTEYNLVCEACKDCNQGIGVVVIVNVFSGEFSKHWSCNRTYELENHAVISAVLQEEKRAGAKPGIACL